MNKLFLLLLVAAMHIFVSCESQTAINADQLETMLAMDQSTQLVDLRTPGEIQRTGRIESAKIINYADQNFSQQIERLDKNKPVILYCASGSRSGMAVAQFKKAGFQKVFDYSGGMMDWLSQRKKTVR